MMRSGTGRMVPASKPFGAAKAKTKKFLVVIQHYDGDVDFAEQLASLIADLERTRNHDADILLVRRSDSRFMSTTIQEKLASKFDTVHTHTCRRFAKGHPFGCNEMWYDLVMLMAQAAPYATDYYAFIPMESDAVPTRPGWISELIREFKSADIEGKAAIGFIHNDPRRHLNGVAVYAADLYNRVGSGILRGGSPQVPYDIRHANSIIPIAKGTPLIRFQYRRPTISPAELFAEVGGVSPAIYHGVKDMSALTAVRDRHVSMKAPAPEQAKAEELFGVVKMVEASPAAPIADTAKRTNVYTYFHKLTGTTIETQTILDLWRKGWATRGWNPVILTFADVVKNPKFEEFTAALDKLPCATGDRRRWAHQFHRWLALESASGGLMVDYDVLPGDFTPAFLGDMTAIHFRAGDTDAPIFGAFFTSEECSKFVAAIMAYDAQPSDKMGENAHVTDDSIARSVAEPAHDSVPLVHFSTEDVGKDRKSVRMEKFLAGK